MEDEGEPFGWCEGVEHHQEGETDGIADEGGLFGVEFSIPAYDRLGQLWLPGVFPL